MTRLLAVILMAVLLTAAVMAVLLVAPTRAFAADIERLQQQFKALALEFGRCADDDCRTRVQSTIAGIIDQLNRSQSEQSGANAAVSRMALPQAGAIVPNGESWQLQMEASWTTTTPGAIVRSRIAGQITLAADSGGVFTGTGPLEAEVIFSDPPGCQSEPMNGVATVEIGGLRDGNFIWVWVVPGTAIRTVGTMTCRILNNTITQENETIVSPEQELMLAMPVLLSRRHGNQLITTGNKRATANLGGTAGPSGEWHRMLRLIPGRHSPDHPLPPEVPPESAADWLLEFHMSEAGFEQSGEVAFAVPVDNGRVQGIGPVRAEGHGISSLGRLILDGTTDGAVLRFIPRAVLDDVSGHGVVHQDLAQIFFNVLFHAGDQRVSLPLRDGAKLTQGPVTWRLRGPKNCRLTITSPKPNTRFRNDGASPGRLTLQFQARMKPAKFAKRITWTLPKFGAANVRTTPPTANGPKLTVDLQGLPQHNTNFGAKRVLASVRTGGCNTTVERTIRLFFPRDANNNPGGKTPNWFYYWSQTTARTGVAPKYGGRQGHCSKPASNNDPDSAGHYADNFRFALPRHYLTCDLTKFGPKMAFVAPFWKIEQIPNSRVVIKPIENTLTGIDTFGLASHHESEHMMHARKWWLKSNGAPIDKFVRPKLDQDNDDVLDAAERALNSKYRTKVLGVGERKTNAGIKDEEFYTQLLAHARWKKGAADIEDWSYPGKQWPK